MLFSPQILATSRRPTPAGFGGGAEATAFLARTSGLDATHINAYIALIDGLVADSIWSKLDLLYIFATQDSTTAALNLVSSSFNATVNGPPTFTMDRGFTGSSGSNTTYINTNFNPTTAPSPKFTQNSAHTSAWNVTNVTDSNAIIGVVSFLGENDIIPHHANGNTYFRTNSGGIAPGTPSYTGLLVATRDNSSTVNGYANGSNVLSNGSTASGAPLNTNFYALGYNNFDGGFPAGAGYQAASISIGSSLSAGDNTNFYNRLRTYMTAVGVP